jgi:hypothetical protein
MNERIEQLLEQASTHAEETVHYYMGQFDGLTWEAKILKARDLKFAELIVRECILISRTSTDGFTAGRRMEERFGVEE